jgi:hypothetical protein
MRLTRIVALATLLVTLASPAFADVTLFIGGTTTPTTRQAKGFAVGIGLIIVAFEFEYSKTAEDLAEGGPSLTTGMGNMLLQTPFAISGVQPYFTIGGGGYRETLEPRQETNFGINTGGGVKISLFGPLRVRADYRVLTLKGAPLYDVVHRVYIGANLKF